MKTKVYTMEDWAKDGVFNASVGLYYEMLNCIPPAYWEGGVMQVGEPYSTDKETRRNLYATFVRDADGNWHFAGNCLYGKTENRESLY